jgi:hypothetical protein
VDAGLSVGFSRGERFLFLTKPSKNVRILGMVLPRRGIFHGRAQTRFGITIPVTQLNALL